MKRKWRDNSGETLIEVLASILIGVLSVALLFCTVMASGSIDRTAKAAEKKFGENLLKAEVQAEAVTVTGNNVKIKNTEAGGSETSVPARFYGGEEAWSFDLKPEDP